MDPGHYQAEITVARPALRPVRDFSSKVIRWEAHATETGDLAKAFIENAVIAKGGARPDYIHAGNGTSMTSKPVTGNLQVSDTPGAGWMLVWQ
jgi:hypothetical protein